MKGRKMLKELKSFLFFLEEEGNFEDKNERKRNFDDISKFRILLEKLLKEK